MDIIIGIDPGKNGGIVALDRDGHVVSVTKMPPTYPDIYDYLNDLLATPHDNATAYIERVGTGMPGQSSKATATFARHCGHIEMALYALGIPTVEVLPTRWQQSLSIGKERDCATKAEWKNRLKAKAQQLYPALWKARKITLATADALLIAHYGAACRRK